VLSGLQRLMLEHCSIVVAGLVRAAGYGHRFHSRSHGGSG